MGQVLNRSWRLSVAAVLFTLRLIGLNPNASIFAVGLSVLCASVAHWSGPLAGTILGGVLMLVAAWPFLRLRKG